jgi:hypothetical protein
LIPGGDRTSCPIFCAHALAALVQFYDQGSRIGSVDLAKKRLIVDCLEKGFERLFDCRTGLAKEQDLLLWPQKTGQPGAQVSFGVSTMCAHVLDKAGRVFGRPEWSMHVPRTFEELGNGLQSGARVLEITIRGTREIVK